MVPGGSKRRLPNSGGSLRINPPLENADCFPYLSVIGRQRAAAVEIMRSWRRAARGVDALQGDEKACDAGREVARIGYGLGRCAFALNPSIDRPLPRISACRFSDRERRRNLKRKKRRQTRGPTVLLFHLRGVSRRARQANDHLLAQAKRSVVPSPQGDRFDRKVSPLWELSAHQMAHQHVVNDR